jgi:hypothetical protein
VCEGRVGARSVWAVLDRDGDRLFGDELFADLFANVGRRSVPPRIVATVMVLQRRGACRTAKRSRRSASTRAGSTPAAGWRSTTPG